MQRSLVLVANRSGAYLFRYDPGGGHLSELQRYDHPIGRAQDSELTTDRSHDSFDPYGHGRRGMDRQHRPHEQVAQQWAASLAEALQRHRQEHGAIRHIVLVADPTMLGLIRGAVDDATARLISVTRDKDFAALDERDLRQRVDACLAAERETLLR